MLTVKRWYYEKENAQNQWDRNEISEETYNNRTRYALERIYLEGNKQDKEAAMRMAKAMDIMILVLRKSNVTWV